MNFRKMSFTKIEKWSPKKFAENFMIDEEEE